ncbi:MAG: glycosyltransferase family 2 protein [Pirellulaceae bacterium]
MIDLFPLTAALLAILLGSALIQVVLGCGFGWKLGRFRRELLPDERCPRCVVVLCLRGSDPFLVRCLDAILDQDYPSFLVRIVVDHPDDPALRVVEEVLERRGHERVEVVPLRAPGGRSSLKCSSLVQAAAACEDSVEFLAQLDADTIPHRTWLRELATALSDDGVGAVTGNRWYMPDDANWAALTRYAWNAAAVVQMYWYRIAWGGTLAIRMAVIREVRLLERWSQAFCEDTMLFRLLHEKGWNVRFVPSLMMINRETCDMPGFCRWVSRQLLTARLYHPYWPAVVLHGLGTTIVLAAADVGLAAALVGGQLENAAWLVSGIVGYELVMFGMLMWFEFLVRRIARSRGEQVAWLSPWRTLRVFLAIPLTQCLYVPTLLTAMRLREVEWRGVTYRIGGPWDVRLVEYRPYQPRGEAAETSAASL